jgi:predicted transcriptional regulator
MRLRQEHRDREETEVAVLQALADRHDEGMTLFELRSIVNTDIDGLERALSGLQHSGLVTVEEDGNRTVFLIASSAIEPERQPQTEESFFGWLKGLLGF